MCERSLKFFYGGNSIDKVLTLKRQVVFERVQGEGNNYLKPEIHTLCPTRWTVRTTAMQRILDNYETLCTTMEESSRGSDDCSRRACGVLALMEKFQT